MPPWSNLWLIGSMALSFTLHFVILHVDILSVCKKKYLHNLTLYQKVKILFKFKFDLKIYLQTVFQVTPLTFDEWITVMKFSIPVVLLDETLKFIARRITDGKSVIASVWGIVLMWSVFFAIIVYGPL